MASSDSCLITPHPTPSPAPSLSPSTPTPLLRPTETPPEDEDNHEATLRYHFRGWALSERSRETASWAWPFGYDIQKDEQRRWVCRACIRKRNPCPGNFDSDGIQNAYNHLFSEHGTRAPFSKTKGTAEKKADSLSVKATGQKSIVEALKLDLHNPREQAIANTVIKRFDRDHFQRLLMNWIVARNHSFSIAEENELREIFDYLNPSVSVRDANLTHTTIKEKATSAFKQHKQKVVE
ncbi:restless-like transposase, partial [Fusarium mundagurra]